MNLKLILTGVVAAVVGLLVGASLHDTAASAEAVEIEALMRAQAAAWNANDLDGFMKAYWDDKEFSFVSKGELKTYKELHERYRKTYQGGGKLGKLTFDQLDVKAMGDGWATARGRWRVEGEGAGEGFFVLTLRKLPQGWRIVHDYTAKVERK